MKPDCLLNVNIKYICSLCVSQNQTALETRFINKLMSSYYNGWTEKNNIRFTDFDWNFQNLMR